MEVGRESILGGLSVDRGGGDHDLNWLATVLGAIVGGLLPRGAELRDGLDGAIALPVAADEEGASHCDVDRREKVERVGKSYWSS